MQRVSRWLTAVLLCAAGLASASALAETPPSESVSSRHRAQPPKVQCMKRLMNSNRRLFYVDADRLCDAAPGPNAGSREAPLAAAAAPPARSPSR